MQFKKLYNAKLEVVNNHISSLFPEITVIPEPLYGAVKYSVSSGGKRIRPILTLATSELFDNVTLYDVLTLASAIEIIHTYSLIHDDLPCMDDDDIRRNRPSCHMIFGEGMAMLAGDALLNMAYELLFEGLLKAKDYKRFLKASNIIARNAGSKGMIAGQCYDLKYESSDTVTEQELFLVHKNKTSKLIEAAVLCGATIAGAEQNQIDSLLAYAEKFGLVFQVTDDILDVIGDNMNFGKPTGSDLENDKLTFPKIYGIDKSKQMCIEYIEEANQNLSIFGERAEFLRLLANNLLLRIK